MKRIDKIIHHPVWQRCYEQTQHWEEKRNFCRHDAAHFAAVARIAWIHNLERGLGLEREVVWAAAFLHDIGRFRQYEEGTPHETASAIIAEGILKDCGFDPKEQTEILAAIQSHRQETEEGPVLCRLLFEADKQSRDCLFCTAESDCNWKSDKKNMHILI